MRRSIRNAADWGGGVLQMEAPFFHSRGFNQKEPNGTWRFLGGVLQIADLNCLMGLKGSQKEVGV